MMCPVFQKWLLELNADMQDQNRHELKLIANAPNHKLSWEQLKGLQGSVTVRCLPKNTTT